MSGAGAAGEIFIFARFHAREGAAAALLSALEAVAPLIDHALDVTRARPVV